MTERCAGKDAETHKISSETIDCITRSPLRLGVLARHFSFINKEVLAFARMTISCNKQEIPARRLESEYPKMHCHGGLDPPTSPKLINTSFETSTN